MLRPYQRKSIDDVYKEWQSHRAVKLVLPTGAGKTFTFSTIIKELNVPTIVDAHRNELVGQMSLALAQLGIHHRIIAAEKTVTEIVKAHREELGKVFFDPTAPVICASVDTLIRRQNPKLFATIRLAVTDESHHVLKENKWGEAISLFPNAQLLGVTATPMRADGKGLGSHSDGVFDSMVIGPTGDDLIRMGYLSPYIIANPPVDDLDFSHVDVGSTGDYKINQLRIATKQSRKLIGSTVNEYLRFARGKLGITFCVDIPHATETAAKYNEAGVPAAVITSETPFLERVRALRAFRERRLLQLVNVDLFGEGFDVPGVEVVSMARKTESFGLYSQQFGRGLRPVYAKGMPLDTDEQRRAAIAAGPKPYAMIIDHVGNVVRHLLPTAPKPWTLDAREKRYYDMAPEDKLKTCGNDMCYRPYRAILSKCPFCGWTPTPMSIPRGRPHEVDGVLELMDLDMLRQMQAEADRIMDQVRVPKGVARAVQLSIMKKHSERAVAQEALRNTIAQWAGYRKLDQLDISGIQKLFYFRFNVDVMTAKTLGAPEANALKERVENDFTNVVR